MKYSSIYLVVKDFDKSLDFYEKLLEMKVSATNGKRFAMFNNDGLNLCLMNGYYDELYPEKKETKGEIYPEYDDMVDIANAANSRKVFIKLQENIRNKNY
ncbi:VOC family protein [Eshraghiella crossota]